MQDEAQKRGVKRAGLPYRKVQRFRSRRKGAAEVGRGVMHSRLTPAYHFAASTPPLPQAVGERE